MKEGIHPDYHPVVFRDRSANFSFLTKSTLTSGNTVEWEDGNTYPVIDVERGLVLGLVFFDHPGPVRTGPFPPRFAAPNSYFIWELFKVSGGVIRHIEAIMAMFPYGMRPGW